MKKELVLLILIVFSSIIFIKPNIEWDEYVYLSNAKYFLGEDVYFESMRPPIMQSLISIFYILKLDNLIFNILPLVILSFFLFSLYLFSKDYKVLILMFSFPIFLMYFEKIMTSILGASFVLMSLFLMKKYFLTKKDIFFYLSFLASSSAFLSRYPLGINLVAISLIYLIFEKKKNYLKLFIGLIIFCMPIIPWVNYMGINSMLSAFNYVSVDSGIFYYFMNFITIIGLSFIFLFFIKNYRYEKKDLFFIIPAFLIFSVFQLIKHKEPRYLIPILPFFAVFFSKIMKNNKSFLILSAIFFIFALNFSIVFYSLLCDNSDNFSEISEFFKDKDKEMTLSNFWPIFSYYSGNPVLAISEPCNINQRVIDSSASYIVVSSFNPCFNGDYSNYELVKVINNNSCEIIKIYRI